MFLLRLYIRLLKEGPQYNVALSNKLPSFTNTHTLDAIFVLYQPAILERFLTGAATVKAVADPKLHPCHRWVFAWPLNEDARRYTH